MKQSENGGNGNGTTMHPPRIEDSHGKPPAKTDKPHGKFPVGLVLIVVGVALAIVALVLFPRLHADREVKLNTQEMAVPTVTILHPKTGPAAADISLPGNVQPFIEATLYAQTNGYVKSWKADIGARVHAGDLLAEIETPEVDQQLAQARAAAQQTTANLDLARTTAARWEALFKQNAVALQEVQEKQGDLAVQQANLAAADANVKRLEAQQAFQKIVAPFDGIVTSRTVDIGTLINGGSGAGQQLFRVAQIQTLRVYVSVPEAFSQSMKIGTVGDLALASAPGVPVQGKIADTAGAIDPLSRTLLVQLQVPNQDGKLLPGGFAQVHFKIVLDTPPLVIPANTLLFRGHGAQVGVVKDDTVSLRTIQIGRDFGNSVEVVGGLQPDDSVILNPSDSLAEGSKVQVKEAPDKPDAKK